MIQVEKDFNNASASLTSQDCKDLIKQSLIDGNAHEFTNWYKKADTKQQLKLIYHNKCAYCEGKPEKTSPIEVEHYRPKKASRKKVPEHNGYYWLGYEWTNLLFACSSCNSPKSTNFPFTPTGIRLTTPPLNTDGSLNTDKCKSDYRSLQREEPLILNPEVDAPENHIIFLPNGEAWGITLRGEKTIEKCKLNREGLVVEGRKQLIDSYENRITREVNNYINRDIDYPTFEYSIKNIIIDIWELRLPETEFSRLGFFMFDKFEIFFLRKFGPKVRKKLKAIYIHLKQEFIPPTI